jgi:hypothetical protein
MEAITRIDEIREELVSLHERLKTVKGTTTKIFSRIIGFYQAVDDWNIAKQAEFKQRTNFSFPGGLNDRQRILH